MDKINKILKKYFKGYDVDKVVINKCKEHLYNEILQIIPPPLNIDITRPHAQAYQNGYDTACIEMEKALAKLFTQPIPELPPDDIDNLLKTMIKYHAKVKISLDEHNGDKDTKTQKDNDKPKK